jgi:hypothetical protein
VEHVARDDDDVRTQRDDAIDGAPEGERDVRFTLIDSGGRQAMVLPEAEVEVGQVNEAHAVI